MADQRRLPYADPANWARARNTPGARRDFTTHDYIPGQGIPTWIKDPKTGLIVVNELKRYVKPFWLTTEDSEVITLQPGEVTDFIPMTVDGKGHFEIFDAFFKSQREEGFTVELFDPGNVGRDRPVLMNREVHVATIASGGGTISPTFNFDAQGSPGRPFRWPQSFFMNVVSGTGTLMARFRNLNTTQTNQIRFVLVGRRWYHLQAPWPIANRMEEIFEEQTRTLPYFFTTDQHVEIEGDGSLAPIMRFGDDAYVEWCKGMAVSTGAFQVRIVETSTQKRLMESPVHSDLAFGSGEFPMLNWEESLFEPNYQLTFELDDLSGDDNVVWLTLGCRKIKVDPKELELIRPGTSPGRP